MCKPEPEVRIERGRVSERGGKGNDGGRKERQTKRWTLTIWHSSTLLTIAHREGSRKLPKKNVLSLESH